MSRTRPDGVPMSSGQPGTEWAERQIEMENEKLRKLAEGSTYFQHAQASANDEAGGRFAKQSPTTVIGAAPLQTVLVAPSWAGFDNGVEPPFGVDIDYVEAVGSLKEQAEAQRILDDQRSAAPPADGSSADVPAVSSLATAVEHAELPTNSPDETFGVSATGPASKSAPTDELAGLSTSLASAATTPVTRAAALDEVQRGAAARLNRRL